MSFADQYKIDLGASNFDFENKVKNGTLREERNNKKGADAAGIIGASAGALDSVTNFVSLFTGQPQAQQTTYVEPQVESQKNMTPWLIGGGVVATLLIIFLLTRQGNGKPTQ